MFKLAAFLLFITISFAQNKVEYMGFNFNLEKLVERKDSSVMIQNGEETGYWVWEVNQDQSSIIIANTSVLHGKVQENVSMQFLKTDPSKGSIDLFMKFGESTIKNNFIINGDQIKGTVDANVRGKNTFIKMDTTADFNIARGFLVALLPTLEIEIGKEVELELFNPIQAYSFPIKLKIAGEEKISVKGGTFDTYRIEMPRTGDKGISNNFYVTKERPFRIVKTEVIENPMVIEFVKNLNK